METIEDKAAPKGSEVWVVTYESKLGRKWFRWVRTFKNGEDMRSFVQNMEEWNADNIANGYKPMYRDIYYEFSIVH